MDAACQALPGKAGTNGVFFTSGKARQPLASLAISTVYEEEHAPCSRTIARILPTGHSMWTGLGPRECSGASRSSPRLAAATMALDSVGLPRRAADHERGHCPQGVRVPGTPRT